MKTFADVRRRLKPGIVLKCIQNTYRPDINGTLRTVVKVQTNAIACHLPGQGDRLFWTYFPKSARDVFVTGPDTFKMTLVSPMGWEDPAHTVTLEFVHATHDWVPSTLGHGETMCTKCRMTNREAAALGYLEVCDA